MSHHILHLVERFLRESDMPPSVFGREAVRDPRLVSDLRSGREAGSKICQRVIDYMATWRELRAEGTVAAVGDRRTCEGRVAARAVPAVCHAGHGGHGGHGRKPAQRLFQRQGDWA